MRDAARDSRGKSMLKRAARGLPRDRAGHALRRRPAPEHEPVERTERAHRADADEVEARYGAFEPGIEDRRGAGSGGRHLGNRLLGSDLRQERRIEHREPGDVDLVSGREHDVIGAHFAAIGQRHVDAGSTRLGGHDRSALVQRRLADHPRLQPLGGRRAIVRAHPAILHVRGEAIERVRHVLQAPVHPAVRDPGRRRHEPLERGPFVGPIAPEPVDRAP
jgi:hypothetical protein